VAFTARHKEQKRELLKKKKRRRSKQIVTVCGIVMQRECYSHVGFFFVRENSRAVGSIQGTDYQFLILAPDNILLPAGGGRELFT